MGANKSAPLSLLYIHIPFCAAKCTYCDFFSGGARIADWPRFTEALLNELNERQSELGASPLETIYLGGGTPSLIPADCFLHLMQGISDILKIQTGTLNEITIEVNPEDVTAKKANVWKIGGVNRVSIGLQTFQPQLLKAINRHHTAEQSYKALQILGSEFDNLSGDLIFGLPGQTMEHLEKDIEVILSYKLKHMSVYSLMLEDGTAMSVMAKQNRLALPDEETLEKMHTLICRSLRSKGYRHYETSNYALPGFESRHNSGYWTGKTYLGLGPSAHSYDGHFIRRANPPLIQEYIKRFASRESKSGQSETNVLPIPFYTEEHLNNIEQREERIMLSLRTAEGLDIKKYASDFGEPAAKVLLKEAVTLNQTVKDITKLIIGNQREKNSLNSTIRIAEEGLLISDYYIEKLIRHL